MKRFLLILLFVCISSVLFAEFTPSATAKSAPEVVDIVPEQIVDLNEKKSEEVVVPESTKDESSFYTAKEVKEVEKIVEEPIVLVSDNKGKLGDIVGAVLKKYVPITSYADKEMLFDFDEEQVNTAYEELKNAPSVWDIIPDVELYAPREEYEGKLVATQIFYIAPSKGVRDLLAQNIKLNLRIIFQKALTTNGQVPVIAIKNSETGEWSTIDPRTVLENWYKEGTYSADFNFFGTFVFLEVRN